MFRHALPSHFHGGPSLAQERGMGMEEQQQLLERLEYYQRGALQLLS
ncbi:hypothetical protein [Mumia zhuanghuii]|nr:hypothetical protein [Mumia zhuanghuii]